MAIIDSFGFLEVHTAPDNGIKFVYSGNMGNNIESVRYCVDALYGKGALEFLLPYGVEDGSPDYCWVFNFQKKVLNIWKNLLDTYG